MENLQAEKPKGHILIVDDSQGILEMLSEMLTTKGYRTLSATDGKQAVEVAQANPPDLILLDIMMPDMTGYQVCERLKTNTETEDVPIIFISALEATQDKILAFSAGGVDYVTKPFQVQEVLARIEAHLTIRNLQKQLQLANQRLSTSNLALQERNADLDAFAHTVSHDLRNPMGVISGFAKILLKYHATMPPEEIHENLEIIDQTSESLINILDELLVLAGVRKIDATMQPLDMREILATAQKRLAYIIEEYQAEIISPKVWPTALGYAPWVEEIWINYISNAIKHGGSPPHITLGATANPNSESETVKTVSFWVRDNGQGISPEEQEGLFTPFTQLEQVHLKGYGMGLAIVRRIAEKLGGEVGVKSEPGQGSTFYFTLPAG
jgi:signal transduction histidine kinase